MLAMSKLGGASLAVRESWSWSPNVMETVSEFPATESGRNYQIVTHC